MCDFLDHVQEQFPITGIHLCEKPSQLLKVASMSALKSPVSEPLLFRYPFRVTQTRTLTLISSVVAGYFHSQGGEIQSDVWKLIGVDSRASGKDSSSVEYIVIPLSVTP
jgi:hypothetical protein